MHQLKTFNFVMHDSQQVLADVIYTKSMETCQDKINTNALKLVFAFLLRTGYGAAIGLNGH